VVIYWRAGSAHPAGDHPCAGDHGACQFPGGLFELSLAVGCGALAGNFKKVAEVDSWGLLWSVPGIALFHFFPGRVAERSGGGGYPGDASSGRSKGKSNQGMEAVWGVSLEARRWAVRHAHWAGCGRGPALAPGSTPFSPVGKSTGVYLASGNQDNAPADLWCFPAINCPRRSIRLTQDLFQLRQWQGERHKESLEKMDFRDYFLPQPERGYFLRGFS